MKKSTKLILSVLTGLLPFWLLSYRVSEFIDSHTGSVKLIGNRRMLLHMHPAAKLMLAAGMTILLLFIWYKLSDKLWSGLHQAIKSIKAMRLNMQKPDTSFIGSFFEFGKWKSEWIVKIIFYFGILLFLLQILNIASVFLWRPGLTMFMGTPFSTAFTGLLLVLAAILVLVLWKCVCEILLIVLRAFELYFIKTVHPEEMNVFYSKPTPPTSNTNVSDENMGVELSETLKNTPQAEV